MRQYLSRLGPCIAASAILCFCPGCGRKGVSEAEFLDYRSGERAAQLIQDVHLFENLRTGDTNLAMKSLAFRIDSNIRQLYFCARERPLDQAARSLYEKALEYRRGTPELERLSDPVEVNGVSVHSILKETNR